MWSKQNNFLVMAFLRTFWNQYFCEGILILNHFEIYCFCENKSKNAILSQTFHEKQEESLTALFSAP